MSDISDLEGVIPNSLRWNAEEGILSRTFFNYETGELEMLDIELGSNDAIFAMDMLTRERGYGKIAKGFYGFKLTPVGSPPPPYPGDDYKPAIGAWVYSPKFGELRVEANAALFV